MLGIIVLAFAIAQSYVHSYEDHHDTDDHEESPWEYLFPDKCQGAKFKLSYHANNITAGMKDVTYDEVMTYCEEMCGPDSCDDIQNHDLTDDAHCQRLKYGDLNGKYRKDVLDGSDDFRDVMMSIMNVICGNIEIECASAVNSLSEIVKESGKYCIRATSSPDESLCQHPNDDDEWGSKDVGPSSSSGDEIAFIHNGETIATIPEGFTEFEYCLDAENVTMNDIFQLESLASCSWGCNGVCITSLTIGGGQVLVGENNNLPSFWIDRDQNYCMDDFVSSSQIKIQNGQVISSKCNDPSPEDFNLPSDYTYVENVSGSTFFKVYDRKDYSGAKGQCEYDGTFLAIPRSQAENDFLMSHTVWELSGYGHHRESIWIGINDMEEEGSFVAVDGGEISWTNWGTDEPNSDWYLNNGVEISLSDRRWHTSDTRSPHKFVCLINVEVNITSPEYFHTESILNVTEQNCEAICNGAMLDQGIDETSDSCSVSLWEPDPYDWEYEDPNLDHENYDHYEEYDHYDYYDDYYDHYDDNHEDRFDFWTTLMADDKCQGAKYMLSYHANNITAGMGDMTSDDLMEYCEEMCGNGAWMTPGGCDDIQFQDLQDDEHCNRLKYGDLNETYRNDVLVNGNHSERVAMISAMNVICGNIEIQCASAINSLSNSGKYCIRVTSSMDFSLCQHHEDPDGSGPYSWSGGAIELKHNGETIATLPGSFEEFEHCLEDVTMYDIFELQSTNGDGVCITSLSINKKQLLVGESNNLESFWIDSDQNYCMDDFMSSSLIRIQNGQIISSACKNLSPNSFDEFQTEMNVTICESICDGAMLDKGIDEYTHPCNFTLDHDDDHLEEIFDLWTRLFGDNKCQGAKYMLTYYHHYYDYSHHEKYIAAGMSYDDVVEKCEEMCGSWIGCADYEYQDLQDSSRCHRLKYGDLNAMYRNDVLDRGNGTERDAMIRAMNVICGNIEIECAAASNSFTNVYVPTDYTFVENPWGNSIYKIYNTDMNYDDAKAQCESDGTFLAIPRSQAENDFILNLILQKGLEKIWIGINDIQFEGLFVGVDGSEISWTNWNHGEPNNFGDEDGVEIQRHNGRWNDAQTHESKQFICSINIEDFTTYDYSLQNCESTCDGADWDQGIDEYTHPCYSFPNFNSYYHHDQEEDDHWNHWDDDDHWDHWDDDHHGNDEQRNDPWNLLIQDECQGAKWALSFYENGFTDDFTGMSHHDLIENCERNCPDSNSCYQLHSHDFLNHDHCHRLIHGDLRERYGYLVLDAPESEDRDKMMSVMNVMCGNVEMECAYAVLKARDERNIFEGDDHLDLADHLNHDESGDQCFDKCAGQMWDEGFEEMVQPCGSSIIHSLSIIIILIISLVR